MAEVNTTLTRQQLVAQLKTLMNRLLSEHSDLEKKLAADTEDPIDPYSHHAYRMIDFGENKQIKEVVYGIWENGTQKTKGLRDLIVQYDETTVTITFDLNGCTAASGSAPVFNPQVPGSTMTLPQITASNYTPPAVPASDIVDGKAQKGYKIYGWCTEKKTPGDSKPHGTVYKGNTSIEVPTTNTTYYLFYAYDPDFVPEEDE